ncbi:uncharacterized protein LOC126319913 [Schistocerca gregaria]|uniref:uncharacterized protein LOC126319913 n=1 Tax=Schistocerca gregaria TaxID=7010 RepID=UPI00211EE3E0|nr:uncharacterized protein LOC126319913 [Schistocerca gregaria]XP_049849573.1 uncharacterized protein LOC126319913 [Schistocerca gregaria]
MKVLMVAEKPSIAQAVSKVLARRGEFTTRKSVATPVHEFDGVFQGRPARFFLTSVMGHVYALDFPASLDRNIEPRELFAAPTVKKESNPSAQVCRHLRTVAKDMSALVLWLDCDREGENIGFEVLENCRPHMVKGARVYRARFSAITGPDVQRAMSNLVSPNENEALAVDARQEIDLKVGVAFTRYQTKTFHFRYANLDSHLISYGPCQTPTLGFCVDRYDEIQAFKSEPYYKLQAWIFRSGIRVKLKWKRPRVLKDRARVMRALEGVADVKWAKVTEVQVTRSKLTRPTPLNTVALLKVASKNLGIGPQQCMHAAEHLYVNGFISYPRTESTRYPEHYDVREALGLQRGHPEWGPYVSRLLDEVGVKKSKSGVDMGDHPPITPTRLARQGEEVSGTEWTLYDYIARHFIASVSPSAVMESQSIAYDIGGEPFGSESSALLEPGFTEVMHWMRPSSRAPAPASVGDQFNVDAVSVKEGRTKPPALLTESELIGMMEKNGIGTDASIPTHIENIVKRNYVRLDSRTRSLQPTRLGLALVHGYHRIDAELVLPKIRASIEKFISDIAVGRTKYEQVIKTSLNTFLVKYDHFVANIDKMDELFHASFSSLADLQVNTRLKPKCGVCNRYMKYIAFAPHRLYCQNCEKVYSMPRSGGLKSDGSTACCPLDGFELVVHSNPKGRTVLLCPKCYNEPTYPGMKPNNLCTQCPNTSCPYNYSNYVLEPTCPQCDVGVLIFDQINGLRIDCNLCVYHIMLPKNTNKLTLSQQVCPNCVASTKTKLIHFKFNEKNTPHPDKLLSFDACIRCDPVISPLCVYPKKAPEFKKHPREPTHSQPAPAHSKPPSARGGGRRVDTLDDAPPPPSDLAANGDSAPNPRQNHHSRRPPPELAPGAPPTDRPRSKPSGGRSSQPPANGRVRRENPPPRRSAAPPAKPHSGRRAQPQSNRPPPSERQARPPPRPPTAKAREPDSKERTRRPNPKRANAPSSSEK